MPELTPEVRAAVRLAYRGYANYSDTEQRTVLAAIIQTGESAEAEAANNVLYHKASEAKAQLLLTSIMEGIG